MAGDLDVRQIHDIDLSEFYDKELMGKVDPRLVWCRWARVPYPPPDEPKPNRVKRLAAAVGRRLCEWGEDEEDD